MYNKGVQTKGGCRSPQCGGQVYTQGRLCRQLVKRAEPVLPHLTGLLVDIRIETWILVARTLFAVWM